MEDDEDRPRLLLPDDVLADLAPRGLAASRCVCRQEWRAVADDRCRHLLRPDLLPLTVGGIFVGAYETDAARFFARPQSSPARRVAAGGNLESFVRMNDCMEIEDCCNGLLLLEGHDVVVANPATRRSARLPPCDGGVLPEGHEGVDLYWSYLAFDPTVSPHYEVISMRHPFSDERLQGLQWPPPVYVMRACLLVKDREVGGRRFALDDDYDDEGRPIRRIDVRVRGLVATPRTGAECSMCIATAILF